MIAGLMGLIAGLILATHLVIGGGLALLELAKDTRKGQGGGMIRAAQERGAAHTAPTERQVRADR